MQWIPAVVLLLLGSVWCQNDLPDELQDIEKNIANIPGLENFNQSALPSLDEVQDAIRKKCEKNGGDNAYDKLEAAKDGLQQCIQSNFNFTKIQEELDESRKRGSMEEVFAKYCDKTPIIQGCVKNLTDTIEPCLEEEEKSSLKLTLNISESLANFVCYKDGDRIAMFVAEGGFECLDSKKDGLQQCANQTLAHKIPADLSLNNLPLFIINDEGCDDYWKLQSCVVDVLETCEDNTPANIVDALFKFIRRITPCKDHPAPASVLGARSRFSRSNGSPSDLAALYKAYEQLKQKYEPHCLKKGGQKYVDEFRDALAQMETCQSRVIGNLKKKNEEHHDFSYDYMCNDFRQGLRGCLVNLTAKMEACSSDAETYVPKFGLRLYDSIFKFHCQNSAMALRKFIGPDRDPCMAKVHDSTKFCLDKTEHIKYYSDKKEAVVTEHELCSDLKILRNCFIETASQKCPNNNQLNELVVGFSDSIYAPCSGIKIFGSSLLILFIVFVSKFL